MKMETGNKSRNSRSSGFTLVEVVLGISVLLICTLALGFSLQAGAVAARQLQEEQVILAQSQTYVDRIVAQEFGQSYDPDPTAAQIEEVFDSDSDPGSASIHQLSRWPAGDSGWKFTLGDFLVEGEWRILVDQDLNGDGTISGDLETGSRVFRICVFFNDRLILQTHRSKEITL